MKAHNITGYTLGQGNGGKGNARRLGLPHPLWTIVFQLPLPACHDVL